MTVTVKLKLDTKHLERAMSLFSSYASDTTIADIGIAHQDAMVMVLTLELGQPVEAAVRKRIDWADLGGAYAFSIGRGPDATLWSWQGARLIRWTPEAPPPPVSLFGMGVLEPLRAKESARLRGEGEILRIIAGCPNHRDLVARLVAQFPGKKRAAGRSNR